MTGRREERWLVLLWWQDHLKEEAFMAKNEGPKDMPTGRPPKDGQMKSLQKAQGTPTRQSELPPYISKDAMPGEKD